MAFIAYPLYLVVLNFLYYANIDFFYANEWLDALVKILYSALFYIYLYGLGIVVFNLLPLYPLDGFRLVEPFKDIRAVYSDSSHFRKFSLRYPHKIYITAVRQLF